ncbi:sensor domain-containing diguanylate cyclase [Aliamphritea spongicola]|uniref:sensor domain-containing diguanylate cyclase n=1 Tax=Aliamphritea spongicola TaxID=707589 RepID=UPI00196ADDCD|nr:diguanylate cyclase [Aliamphritea spongicola]MBN3560768.1 diguanylate cyclase [Aliamphritea spongicola]
MPRIAQYPLFISLLTLLFLAVVTGITSYAINNIEQATKQQIRTSLKTVLQTTVTTYQVWIQYRKRDVKELATTPAIVNLTTELLEGNTEEQSLALTRMREYLAPKLHKENDLGFFVISPARLNIGSMRDNNLDSLNLIHMQRPGYLNRAFNGETLFIPTLFSDVPLSGRAANDKQRSLTIFVVSPIRQGDEIIAVLALRINLNTLFNHVSGLARLGDTGETYAFDERGMMITESRFEHQLRKKNLISPDSNSILNIRITDPGGNLLEGHVPDMPPRQQPLTLMAAQATRGISGINVDGYRDYRGVPVFGAWLWDHDLGFGITTEIDVEEGLTSYYQTRQTVLGVLSLITLMALLLLVYIIRSQQAKKRYLEQSKDILEQLVEQRTAELDATRKQLESANRELEIQATTDSLTQLANRRSFDAHLQGEWLQCSRDKKPLAILLIDIDHFKEYNDHYGHLQGDECLRHVAQALQDAGVLRRPGDLIARYGGEEFAIILSAPSCTYVSQTAERLREHISALEITHQASAVPEKILTISVGYAVSRHLKQISPEVLFDQADQALYRAKSRGRNQISGTGDCSECQEAEERSAS